MGFPGAAPRSGRLRDCLSIQQLVLVQQRRDCRRELRRMEMDPHRTTEPPTDSTSNAARIDPANLGFAVSDFQFIFRIGGLLQREAPGIAAVVASAIVHPTTSSPPSASPDVSGDREPAVFPACYT